MLGFFFVAFVIFSGAFFAAYYYTYTMPRRQEAQILTGRMRELRARGGQGGGGGGRADLMLRGEGRGSFAFLSDFFAWIGLLRRLQEALQQGNMKYKAANVFGLCLMLFIGTFLVATAFSLGFLLKLVASIGVAWIPMFFINRKCAARLSKFEEGLPDAIDLFNRSMKAGHNIHSGLDTIASETANPIKMEFKKVTEELALGSTLEAALHGLGKRIPIIDLKFFITGLILQRQTGANMVLVLENLAVLVRERLNLSAKMKSSTAQARFSAGLLCALPIVVGIGFTILKPDYMRLLVEDETGNKFLTYAIISEIVGILVIRKLANPKI